MQEITLSDVRRTAELDPPQSRECRQCTEEKLWQEANDAGLILLDQTNDSKYRYYQFKNCAHKQKISTANVRTNSF